MKSILILAMLTAMLGTANAQPLTLAQQRDDFAIFRGSLEEGHGGLYYFIDKATFARQCDSVGATFRDGATVDTYYLKLRYLITLLRHGHSRISLPGEGEPNYWLSVLKKDRRYLPLQLMVIDHKLYALADCSEEQTIQKGTEILSINGKPTQQLLDSMARYVPADGINQTFKTYFLYKYYYFHFLYNLLYPTETAFELTLADQPRPVRVSAQLPSAMEKNYKTATGKGLSYYEKQLAYRADVAPGTAYLKVGSFYKGFIEGFGQRFEPFIDSTFRDLTARQTKTLILDIRNNEGGGDAYSEKLFAYFTAKLQEPEQMTVPSKTFSLAQYAINLSDEIKGYIADPAEFLKGDGTLEIKEKYLFGGPREPAKNRFTGKVIVLINGGVFSAGNTLVSNLYKHREATGQSVTFVGEENGGDIYSNVLCAGQSYNVILPNSKIALDLPFICFGKLSKNYPAKRLPDYRALPTIGGLLQGRDEVLQFAIDQIATHPSGRAKVE